MDISSWYEKSRDSLLALINESQSINIPEKYADELSFVQKKCKENMFEIAFLGEFQGGKSTTFNALCDGRDISPRGIGGGGIKTSAAVISAQNISGDETKDGMSEWAEISYKTEENLVKITFDIVVKYGTEITKNIFDNVKPVSEEYVEKVKLSNPQHKQWLLTDLEQIWQIYNQDKLSFSHDDLDMLRIGTIIVKFFGCSEYFDIIKKEISSIDNFQHLVKFPIDWEQKWTNGFDTSFSFEEISFVFVAAVLLKIKSNNLARLGCRITDCPGLFANKYDTDVALDAIRRADAVLYLVDGGRQIGDTCLRSIKYIKDCGMLDKIFIAANLKGRHDYAKANIIPSSQSSLKNGGIETKIHPYNARLAFLAMQGKQIFRNSACLTDLDYNNIIEDAKSEDINSDDVREIWPEFVRNCGFNCKVQALRTVEELNDDSLKLVLEHSGLEEILTDLESDIITKKSRSILYDNGSKKVVKALIAYEDNLLSLENSLKEKEENVTQELNIQRDLLATFISDARGKIGNKRAEVNSIYARNFANQIIDNAFNTYFFDTASKEFGRVFVEESDRIQFSHKTYLQSVLDRTHSLLEELITSQINNSMQMFIAPCDDLQRYFDKVNGLVEELNQYWIAQGLQDRCYLRGLNINITCSASEIVDSSVCASQVINMALDYEKIKDINKKYYNNIMRSIWGVLKWFLVFPKIFQWCFDNDSAPPAQLVQKIRVQLVNSITEVRMDLIDKIAEGLITNVIEPQFNNLENNVSEISGIFEKDRVQPIEANLHKAKKEKEAAIAENNHIRTQQIMPLRERSEEFSKQIVSEMEEYKILDCDCVEEIKKSIGDTFSSKKTDNFMNVKAYFEHKLKVFKSSYPKHAWIQPKNEPYQIDGGWRQDFGDDSYDFLSLTCRTFDSNVFEVHGGIREKWINEGAQGGKYGWPMSDEIDEGNIRRSVFEHGSIEWSELAGHEANGSLD